MKKYAIMDEILHSFMGILINHYKDPNWTEFVRSVLVQIFFGQR